MRPEKLCCPKKPKTLDKTKDFFLEKGSLDETPMTVLFSHLTYAFVKRVGE